MLASTCMTVWFCLESEWVLKRFYELLSCLVKTCLPNVF